MSQIACPKHLSVYMRGSIPDRYTADPAIDLTDDECLRDIGFTDVSDGTIEDDIIALIDAGSETEFEADEICDTDSASEDTDEQSLDDGQEVVERADRPEGQGVGRASGAAGRGQPAGHFHDT